MISIKAVFSCISKTLNVNVKKISINSSSKDFENWDSLAQLSILTMLDNKLDGKIFTRKYLQEKKCVL
jgi:acyl carrier protein